MKYNAPSKPPNAQCADCEIDEPYRDQILAGGVSCRGCGRSRPHVNYALVETTRKARVSTGLYRKFEVHRTDGRDAPGEKHHGCYYFVLDINHDKYAAAALRAYADACEADMPELARDARDLAEVNDHDCGRKVHDGYFPPACFRAIVKIDQS